jgi:hypothetical protein
LSPGQDSGAFLRAEHHVSVADQVNGTFQTHPIHNDRNSITIEQLADRAAGKGLGGNLSHASAR